MTGCTERNEGNLQKLWIKSRSDNNLGKALQYFATIRVHIRAGEKIMNPNKKDEVIGHIVVAKVVKNKTAMPFKVAQFPLIYGKGIDRFSEIVDIALSAPWMVKAGAWLRIEENDKVVVRGDVEMRWNGREKLLAYLQTDPGLCKIFSKYVMTGEFNLDEVRGSAPEAAPAQEG